MKREMEVIRQILLNVEADKYQYGERIHLDGISDEVCAYHVALMRDSGLVDADILESGGSPFMAAIIFRITSAGHDFCDAIRNDTVWNKAKARFLKPGATYTISIFMEWVKLEVRKQVFGDLPSG